MVKRICIDYSDDFRDILNFELLDSDDTPFPLNRFIITTVDYSIIKTTDDVYLFKDVYDVIKKENIKVKVFEAPFIDFEIDDISYIVVDFNDKFTNLYQDYYLINDTSIGKKVHNYLVVLFNFSEVERVLSMLKEKKPKMDNIIKKLELIDRKYFLALEVDDGE